MVKRILVDMDGVLADVYSRYFKQHDAEFGIRLNIKDIIGLKEAEAFPNQLKWVNTQRFFRTIPVMPGIQQVLSRSSSFARKTLPGKPRS